MVVPRPHLRLSKSGRIFAFATFYLLTLFAFAWFAFVSLVTENISTSRQLKMLPQVILVGKEWKETAGMLTSRSSTEDLVQQKPDVGVYTVGNVITLACILLFLLIFLIWALKLHTLSHRLDSWIKAHKTRKLKSSLPISTPLTPPQGSLFGDWARSRKSAFIGDERFVTPPRSRVLVSGGPLSLRPISPISDIFSDTTPLMAAPQPIYVSPHRKQSDGIPMSRESTLRGSDSMSLSPIQSAYLFFHDSPTKKERRYALIPWAAPRDGGT